MGIGDKIKPSPQDMGVEEKEVGKKIEYLDIGSKDFPNILEKALEHNPMYVTEQGTDESGTDESYAESFLRDFGKTASLMVSYPLEEGEEVGCRLTIAPRRASSQGNLVEGHDFIIPIKVKRELIEKNIKKE